MDLKLFNTREELVTTIKSDYLANGVSVVLHKSSNDRKVVFKCYNGGKYRNPLELKEIQRRRKTGSRLIECPFVNMSHYSKKENHWEDRKD